MSRIAKVYAAYAKKLRAANALDFDDIILAHCDSPAAGE